MSPENKWPASSFCYQLIPHYAPGLKLSQVKGQFERIKRAGRIIIMCSLFNAMWQPLWNRKLGELSTEEREAKKLFVKSQFELLMSWMCTGFAINLSSQHHGTIGRKLLIEK